MIQFVKKTQNQMFVTYHYEGYGYLVRVSFDGIDTVVIIEPYDPVDGVDISYFNDTFTLRPPQVNVNKADALIQNIKQAEHFCREFEQRKNELLKAPAE